MEQATIEVAEFEPIRLALSNAKIVDGAREFDLSTPKGEKEARSYIAKLRTERADVKRAKDIAKAGVLAKGRAIDAQANELTAEYTTIIDARYAPIEEAETREKNRVKAHQDALDLLRQLGALTNEPVPLDALKARLKRLEDFCIDATFEEFMAEASTLRTDGIAALQLQITREQEILDRDAELEKLREKQAETDRLAREEQIRKDATAKAEREAKEREETVKRKAKAREDEAAQAIIDAAAASKKREEAAAQEVRDAFARQEAEKQRLADEEAEAERIRQADARHRTAIEDAVLDHLTEILGSVAAGSVLEELVDGRVPHVEIQY